MCQFLAASKFPFHQNFPQFYGKLHTIPLPKKNPASFSGDKDRHGCIFPTMNRPPSGCRIRRRKALRIAGSLLIAALLLHPAVAGESLTVTDRVEGRTPLILGINTGPMPSGSAFPEWIRNLGVNGVRLRLSARPAEPNAGDPGTERELSARAGELRRLRSVETRKIWRPSVEIADSSLVSLRREGIELLATITVPFSYHLSGPEGRIDWPRAWEFWKSYYAQAYQLALRHQVRRYQLFNEPDHKASMELTQQEYSARLRVGTDAIQAALEDASGDSGQRLEPLISAPCTASIRAFSSRRLPESRDPVFGWGELTMRDRHGRLDGRNDPSWSRIQQYAYQQYSIRPDNFLRQLNGLRDQVTSANGGHPFPIVMTEFNVHTAADFSGRPTTLDSPEEFSGLGAMATAIARSGLEEMYFFRLTMSRDPVADRIKKNGIHHVNETVDPPEITGTTRGAEVIRLSAEALAGGRDLLRVDGGGQVRSAATRSGGETQLLLANTNGTEAGLEIRLPPQGGQILNTLELVTEERFGTILFPGQGTDLRVSLPARSFARLASRPVDSLAPKLIPAEASFSSLPGTLLTGGRDSHHTLLEFPSVKANHPLLFLHLTGNSTADHPVPLHLYLVQGPLPPGAELNAGRLPFVRKNPLPGGQGLTVEGLGRETGGLRLLGGFTIGPGEVDTWVEISRAVRRLQPGEKLALLLSRDIRQKGDSPEQEPVAWRSAELALFSGRSTAPGNIALIP